MTSERLLILVCSFALLGTAAAHSADSVQRQVVLVASSDAQLPSLSQAELRRVFLGIPLQKQGAMIRPLRNRSDELLYEVFLQKVVFMSSRTYERQLVSRVFRANGERPPEFEDQQALVDALRDDPASVTFMWNTTAQNLTDVKVIQPLWEGTFE